MLETVDEWLYKTLGGIEILNSKSIRIKPYFSPSLDNASSSVQTANGLAKCSWERNGEKITVNIKIPFNIKATVLLSKNDCKTSSEMLTLTNGEYKFII